MNIPGQSMTPDQHLQGIVSQQAGPDDRIFAFYETTARPQSELIQSRGLTRQMVHCISSYGGARWDLNSHDGGQRWDDSTLPYVADTDPSCSELQLEAGAMHN